MSDTITREHLPTSFGTFKPTGHVMMGLPSMGQVESLTAALREAGWQAGELVIFTPRESSAEMDALVDAASPLAGFGYEITLQRRYIELARQGYGWLLVKAEDTDTASRAAAIAREHGATLAVHYRLLVVEELI